MGRERGHRERKEGERREAEAVSSEEWTKRKEKNGDQLAWVKRGD